MENRPKVSIITVVLNGRQFADGYFKTVVPFLNADTELVIIDGGSTDGTLEVIRQNSGYISYWHSGPDEGIYDAMNKGIAQARGLWLYFMGIDDRLLPGFTAMQAHLQHHNTIYYGKVISKRDQSQAAYTAYLLTKRNISHQAIFYPAGVFNKYRYQTCYPIYADYQLNLQCWNDEDFTFEYHDLYIADFYPHGVSAYIKDDRFERERPRLFKRYLEPSAYYHYVYRTQGVWGMLKQLAAND